jgi:hypothetical protein
VSVLHINAVIPSNLIFLLLLLLLLQRRFSHPRHWVPSMLYAKMPPKPEEQ